MTATATRMQLKILVPHGEVLSRDDVVEVSAQTVSGNWALLPRRLDCVAALVPGILLYQDTGGAEHAVAVDEGALTKTGTEVVVAVRQAVVGADLASLRGDVVAEFQQRAQREAALNTALARLQSGFVRRFMQQRHG